MEYEKFKKQLKERLEQKTGIQTEVYFSIIEKNNQSRKEIITFHETGVNTMPAIHLKELYEDFLKDKDMNRIVFSILHTLEIKMDMDIQDIMGSWESAKEKICVKVINYEWNQEMLREVPHRRVLDLAIIFHVRAHKTKEGIASVQIQQSTLNAWGVTIAEVWKAAMENLRNQKYLIKDMAQVIAEMLDTESEDISVVGAQYILMNEEQCYGAAGILRDDLLREFAERIQGNFYILPSSLHELILVPEKELISAEELRVMVTEINETQVEKEDRLSNAVYYYDRKIGRIMVGV